MINRINIIFILAALSYNTIHAQKQMVKSSRIAKFESIDAFAMQIFKLIKTNDTIGLYDLVMRKDDSNDLLDRLIVPKNKSKVLAITNLENKAHLFVRSFMNDYSKFLKDASSMRINLQSSQFEFINFKHIRTLNVEQADIEINFSYHDKRYDIILEGCVKSKPTWLLGGNIRVVVSDFQQPSQQEMISPDRGLKEETPVER